MAITTIVGNRLSTQVTTIHLRKKLKIKKSKSNAGEKKASAAVKGCKVSGMSRRYDTVEERKLQV